ncbi:hypothetical protein WR25_21411 [Diploscapter pachys]|uniref:Uncharacterized protein n=1 Tax=Diploscapter pachys TaxID=2018661 RepID=A0A2A2JC68_9BILA|nr:hypothetical protein WR25_21411 [Diploscapter pachys]
MQMHQMMNPTPTQGAQSGFNLQPGSANSSSAAYKSPPLWNPAASGLPLATSSASASANLPSSVALVASPNSLQLQLQNGTSTANDAQSDRSNSEANNSPPARNFSTANSNGNGQMTGGNGSGGYAAAAIGSVGPTAYPDWSAAQRATFLAAQANSTATAGKFPSSTANGLEFVTPMNMNDLYTTPFAAAQWNAAAAYGYPQQYQQYAAFGAAPMMDMTLAGRRERERVYEPMNHPTAFNLIVTTPSSIGVSASFSLSPITAFSLLPLCFNQQP